MEASEVLHVEQNRKASPKRGKYALKGTHYVKQLNYSAFLRIFQTETQEALWKARILS